MSLPTRKPNRLADYDYSTPNAYFVTVCTSDHHKMFWENDCLCVESASEVRLSESGMVVQQAIAEIPVHYSAVLVDHFVIMPNHVHLLLRINSDCSGRLITAPTISTIVRMMKRAVSKSIGCSIWQKGFYDHIIRNDVDYRNTWNYIEGNPSKWFDDDLYM